MKVRELQAILSGLDPEAEVVIVDDDRCTRELRVGVGGMASSVTGREKYVRGCGTKTVGLEPGDELGESLEMTLTEDAVDEIEANCNYDDGYPSCSLLFGAEDETVHMVHINAVLTVEYPQSGYEEEMTVVKMNGRLRDGTCPFVTLEGEGSDRYIVTILPSGKVVFETGMWGMATPFS